MHFENGLPINNRFHPSREEPKRGKFIMLTLMEHEKSNCRTDEHAPHLKLFYSVQAMPTSKVFYLLTLDAPNQNNVQSPVLPFVGTADESEG